MKTSSLENEWTVLQNQYDSYEKFSLLIKLSNIGLLSGAYFFDKLNAFVLLLILILWLQDAIWKTFQARIDVRLLQVENYLGDVDTREVTGGIAYQYNTQYLNSRPGSLGLIKEYALQAMRPTIAYPHVLLVLVIVLHLVVV